MKLRSGGLGVLLIMAGTATADEPAVAADLTLALESCIDTALARNQQRLAARQGLQEALAVRGQAGSAYWPQVDAVASLSRRDEDPLFVFPEFTDVFNLNLLNQALATEATVPRQRLVLQDRLHFVSDANAALPLYTGGLRGALVRQADAGVAAARALVRRTDIDVIYEVRHAYYQAVLAHRLLTITQTALARLEVTLGITERLYQTGVGPVNKTDWLRQKLVVDAVHASVIHLQSQVELSRAALAHAIGFDWQDSVRPAANVIPFEPLAATPPALRDAAFSFSPDWARLQQAVKARQAAIDEAVSGRLPRIALLGNVKFIANRHETGIVDRQDKRSWLVALGMEVPIFDGFLTRHRIEAARARLRQLEHEEIRLQDALGLQVRALWVELDRAQKHEAVARGAVTSAADNRELNERAYHAQMVEVEDMVRAQMTESIALGVYETVRFEHYQTRARLEQVIGHELGRITW